MKRLAMTAVTLAVMTAACWAVAAVAAAATGLDGNGRREEQPVWLRRRRAERLHAAGPGRCAGAPRLPGRRGGSLLRLNGSPRGVATEAAFAGRLSAVKRKLRILVAKAGLDGHDRGAKVVARALADAGYEVIYSGLHQTAEMIAAAAQQESVDAVGLSMMSGAHMTQFPAILDALKARGAHDVVVFGGGIVPDEDAAALKALGVAAIFTPGTSTQAIVDWIERELRPRVEGAAA